MENLRAEAARAIEEAANHLARATTQCSASAQFGQAAGTWITHATVELQLSPELIHWYRSVAPIDDVEIPDLGNSRRIYPISHLVEYQLGYRWIGTSTGGRGNRIAGWPSDWIVIGDIGADPIIADGSRSGTAVALAAHGEGDWRADPIAPTLATFLEAQARWIEVCLLQTGAVAIPNWTLASERIWGEHASYLPEVSAALVQALSPVLSKQYVRAWLQ